MSVWDEEDATKEARHLRERGLVNNSDREVADTLLSVLDRVKAERDQYKTWHEAERYENQRDRDDAHRLIGEVRAELDRVTAERDEWHANYANAAEAFDKRDAAIARAEKAEAKYRQQTEYLVGHDTALAVALADVKRLRETLERIVTAFEGTTQAPDAGSSVRWVRLINAAEAGRQALAATKGAFSKEWCAAAADREQGSEVIAGVPTKGDEG